MSWLIALFRRRRVKRTGRVVRVQISEDGFVATRDHEEAREISIKWPEIELVYTDKIDCFVYDMILLAFEHPRLGVVRVPEDSQGFDSLMSAMNKSLPGINPDWYLEVQMPPFAENLTVLYRNRAQN